MASANPWDNRVFETALKHAKQSIAVWPTQYCDDIDIAAMTEFDRDTKQRIRALMESSHDHSRFLFTLQDYSMRWRDIARQKLSSGQVAAVDGTDALQQITLMNTSAYAVAVGYITSKTRGDPHVTITTTNTRYIDRRDIQHRSRDELAQLCDELDIVRIDQSWPTTFREYQERRVALTCGTDIVLLDGPVWTQNLVTQQSGRELFSEMDQSVSTFIGVIKNISGSWTMSKWCGYALEPGEGFVVGPVKAQFHDRFRSQYIVQQWVDGMPDDYIRVVFRPHQKAFAFECRLSQLPLAVAILLEDASPTINHEIPLLLELIDSQVRAGFHAAMAAEIVVSKIHQDNYQMGVDVTNERDYR